MINSKKKAQISIEALIIVGVLVIGGVIFASVYLNNLGVHTKRSSELSGLTDGFMNDLSGWDNTGTGGNTGTGTGTDTNGEDENGEVLPGTLRIYLSLSPIGSTPINTNFGVKVDLNNQTGETNAVIKEIEIKKDDLSTSNCSYNNQTPASIYTGLNVSFTNNSTILNLNCSVEGEYRIYVKAGISGVSTYDYMHPQGILKIITSTIVPPEGDIFSVKVAVPENQKYFFREDRTDFIAVLNPEKQAGETDSCVWYVNESKEIPIGSQPDSCRLEGIFLNDTSLFAEGLNTITVYAQRSTSAAGKKLEANAKIEINILKPINPGILYLSAPRNLIVGESFNLKVYGITEGQVNATRNISNFTFTGNKCAITSATPVCGSTTVNSTNVYYCDYPAVCSSASYAQTSPYDPSEVVASLQGTSETARFYSEYDLLFYSGNCSVTATSYGKMNTCVSSINGMGHNADYWTDPSYGLLKTSINVSSSIIENNYGILKIYIE